MADHFLPSLDQNFKHTFSLADSDPNTDFMNHFSGIYQNHLMGIPLDNLFPHLQESLVNSENFPGLFIQQDNTTTVVHQHIILNDGDQVDRKRKAIEISINSPANSSPQVSDNGIIQSKKDTGRGKRVKGNEKKDEKPREVVHVRAKRGQATDSHSLAERVRREKINERLRCLQDIVPGCYKTMGMAVMLDEIINYVQSLQNQVEFLSMKLSAASTSYDFNLQAADTLEKMQRQKAIEALKIQNGGSSPGFPSLLH